FALTSRCVHGPSTRTLATGAPVMPEPLCVTARLRARSAPAPHENAPQAPRFRGDPAVRAAVDAASLFVGGAALRCSLAVASPEHGPAGRRGSRTVAPLERLRQLADGVEGPFRLPDLAYTAQADQHQDPSSDQEQPEHDQVRRPAPAAED